MSSMKALGDNVIMAAEVCPALIARIDLWSVEVDHHIVHTLRVPASRLGQGHHCW